MAAVIDTPRNHAGIGIVPPVNGTNTAHWQAHRIVSRESIAIPKSQRQLISAAEAIRKAPPTHIAFLHSTLCQVGIPRCRLEARTFERRNGGVSIRMEAGVLWDGLGWKEQPLPYGTIPRLVLMHLSSEAVRTKCRTVDVGASMRAFLHQIGVPTNGGQHGGYGSLKRQVQALAACRLMIGMHTAERAVTLDAKPIKRFDAWLHGEGAQRTFWPGHVELSEEFFVSLSHHAVPLDPRAIASLKSSALALDVYAWLSQRLFRVSNPRGDKLSWSNLRDQFGQEYRDHRNFKREFRRVLRQVLAVYPAARIDDAMGGILIRQSPPPIARACIALSGGQSPPGISR